MVVSAVFEGKELVTVPSVSNYDKSTFNSSTSALLDDEVTNKVSKYQLDLGIYIECVNSSYQFLCLVMLFV